MRLFEAVSSVSPHPPRLLAALNLALASTVALFAGCNDYGNTFQNPTGASISSLAPSNANAGSSDFTLTVFGGGFVAKTVVQWNGKTIPTQVATNSTGAVTGVTATVSASLIAKPGTAFVNTLNPFSGTGNNGLSNSIAFIINPAANPVPSISSMSPTTAAGGSAALTLTVNGSSFIPPTSGSASGSVVYWNEGGTQTTLVPSSVTSTQIQVTVPASLLVNSTTQAITAVVTVYNPPSSGTSTGPVTGPSSGGGGVSPGGLTFTITPAGATHMAASQTVAEDTPAVSIDGRYVAYAAAQGDHTQIFARDTCEGADASCQPRTLLVSAAADGVAGNDDSRSPSMSSDGRYVAFSSAATNLASGTQAGRQVYLRDTCLSAAANACTPSTQLISTDASGSLGGTESILPSVSASGRYVAFLAVTPSQASAAQASPQNKSGSASTSTAVPNSGYRQVFVRDTCLGATGCTPKTSRISLQSSAPAAEAKPPGPALDATANHVALAAGSGPALFTRSIAVDDQVFLAVLRDKKQ